MNRTQGQRPKRRHPPKSNFDFKVLNRRIFTRRFRISCGPAAVQRNSRSFQYLKFTASLATSTDHIFVFAYNFGTTTTDTGDDKDDNVGLYIEN